MIRPRQIRDAVRALEEASSYAQWLQAAHNYDAVTGGDVWRMADPEDSEQAVAMRQSTAKLAQLRAGGDADGLVEALTEAVFRHLGEIRADEHYSGALAGPKRLLVNLQDELEASLLQLAHNPPAHIPRAGVLARFRRSQRVFGRSALLLSGGATWGFHHLGVVKALFEQDLLPEILSGASTGAMIAAGVCSRTKAELRQMYEETDDMRLDGLLPVGLRRAWQSGAWLDPERLHAVLKHNCGPWTFAEAQARSGRILNISVSPARTRQRARLLNALTSPQVTIASAALASSALPALFPPVQLQARAPGGDLRPYMDGELWVDGSFHGDLPKNRLARLHNVNHFIVSQANPHALPLVRQHGQRGIVPTLAGLVGSTARTQAVHATDLARRASTRGTASQLADRAHGLVSQDYRGDIDIHPPFSWSLYKKVVANPSREDLAHFIAQGERAVWPLIPKITEQTRLGRTFSECIRILEST
ncbi:MAG: TAG lipase/steryl ester hydrolase/phospholipase A2/LPA acyltransferase [Cognaticolwellia sp.]|jgi:TAG lipase/steryl ester hydrolase/phospholipase A2/LPA acyltransferase